MPRPQEKRSRIQQRALANRAPAVALAGLHLNVPAKPPSPNPNPDTYKFLQQEMEGEDTPVSPPAPPGSPLSKEVDEVEQPAQPGFSAWDEASLQADEEEEDILADIPDMLSPAHELQKELLARGILVPGPRSASFGLTDYSQVDSLTLRVESVDCGKLPGLTTLARPE